MKIIKGNIDKVSLNELGDDTHIWEVMLPEIRKHLDGESSIFNGIRCNHQFEGYTEAGNALVESAVIAPLLRNIGNALTKGPTRSSGQKKTTVNSVITLRHAGLI